LSSLVSKKTKWNWTEECQRSFEEMKRVMSKETLLAFPDFEDTFHIYTDASDYQLGAVIMQKGKPLAFYSRKLNAAQKRYTTGEQELLSIVETLKEFRNILLGQKLVVHTDHKNIIYGNLTNDRIARWRLLLEEFGPEYVHVKGQDNVVADALSRMDMEARTPETDERASEVASEAKGDAKSANHIISYCLSQLERDDGRDDIRSEPESLAICLAAGEDTQIEEYPLSPRLIAEEQQKDTELQESIRNNPEAYTKVTIENTEVTAVNERMVIPKSLRGRIVAWTHHYLVHPGGTRLEKTLSKLCTWPNMARDIQAYTKTCRKCQLCKTNSKKYGQMPTKEAEPPIPWNRVNVDLIGPYEVKLKGTRNKKIQLRAMTMIDPTTGWFEVKEIDAPTADCCQRAMDDTWFNRYPKPEYIGFDNGREFKLVFEQMTKNYGLKAKTGTSYNPQSNGVIERVHQVLGDMLRTFELEEQDLDARDPFGSFLSAAAYAIRSTYHTVLEASPAELVFGRHMLLPVKFTADWQAIQAKRQKRIEDSNARENASRIEHEYKIGDLIMKTRPGKLAKLRRKRDGPYTVTHVYTNGTLRIRKGVVAERISVRRVSPYYEPERDTLPHPQLAVWEVHAV
jgi:transposase InsO family protein